MPSSDDGNCAQALHTALTAELMATRALLRQLLATMALLSIRPEAYLAAILERSINGLGEEARSTMQNGQESPIFGLAAERLGELMRSVPGWSEIDGGKLN